MMRDSAVSEKLSGDEAASEIRNRSQPVGRVARNRVRVPLLEGTQAAFARPVRRERAGKV